MASGYIQPAPHFSDDATYRCWRHEIQLMLGSFEAQLSRLERLDLEMKTYFAARQAGSGNFGSLRVSEPDPVVCHMHIQKHVDGRATISLDGGTPFVLAPQLAEVFVFLASGEPESGRKDQLVGWRSRDQILQFLEQKENRSFHPRYINNLVHRLKEALEEAGYSRALLQTHKHKGVRLSYKQSAQGTPASMIE